MGKVGGVKNVGALKMHAMTKCWGLTERARESTDCLYNLPDMLNQLSSVDPQQWVIPSPQEYPSSIRRGRGGGPILFSFG